MQKQPQSLPPRQQQIIDALGVQLKFVPVGPDGRPNRRSIKSAIATAAAQLAMTGMHRGKAMRLCGEVAAPRVVQQQT